jgi:hypothetical protein
MRRVSRRSTTAGGEGGAGAGEGAGAADSERGALDDEDAMDVGGFALDADEPAPHPTSSAVANFTAIGLIVSDSSPGHLRLEAARWPPCSSGA